MRRSCEATVPSSRARCCFLSWQYVGAVQGYLGIEATRRRSQISAYPNTSNAIVGFFSTSGKFLLEPSEAWGLCGAILILAYRIVCYFWYVRLYYVILYGCILLHHIVCPSKPQDHAGHGRLPPIHGARAPCQQIGCPAKFGRRLPNI